MGPRFRPSIPRLGSSESNSDAPRSRPPSIPMLRVATGLLVLYSGACGACDDPVVVGEDTNFPAEVTIHPAWSVIYVGETGGVFVEGTREGQPAPDLTVTWSSLVSSIAAVTPQARSAGTYPALIQGVSTGATLVQADVEEKTLAVPVVVTDRPGCSTQVDLIPEIGILLDDPEFCQATTSDVFLGQIDHSWWNDNDIPNQDQDGSYTDIAFVGGRFHPGTSLGDFLDAYPDGEDGVTRVEQPGAPDTWGHHLMVLGMKVQQPIPETPDQPLEYSLVLDWDRNSANNYIPQAAFADDWAQDGDFVFKVNYSLDTGGWNLEAWNLDSTQEQPTPVSTATRVLMKGSSLVWIVAYDGPMEGPLARWTAFRHGGDFGLQGGAWSGDYTPDIGTMFDVYRGYDGTDF